MHAMIECVLFPAVVPRHRSMPHLQELLTRLLGGEVRLFVTPCVSAELRSLGPDFAAAAGAARAQKLHKCDHAVATAPSECLAAVVTGGNPDHWWIATQDRALRAELQAVRGVPLLFASVNGLHLADPPHVDVAAVSACHNAAQQVPAHERASAPLADLADLRPRDESWKKFRRKRTKGPNPLSVRKKQPKALAADAAAAATKAAQAVAPCVAGAGGGGGNSGGSGGAHKRKRKRGGQGSSG